MATTHTIVITLINGDFTYKPSTLNAKRNQKVTWTSKKGAFAVTFQDQSPFPNISYSSHPDGQGNHVIDPVKIRSNADGHNHYAVALVLMIQVPGGDPIARVKLDSGCPDIVVSGTEN
jgi:hypothetical protein